MKKSVNFHCLNIPQLFFVNFVEDVLRSGWAIHRLRLSQAHRIEEFDAAQAAEIRGECFLDARRLRQYRRELTKWRHIPCHERKMPSWWNPISMKKLREIERMPKTELVKVAKASLGL
jgi:hypothetical protein